MKKLLIPALFLFAMAITFTSCKKDEESSNTTTPTPTPAPSKTEILTGNYYWKLTALTVNPAIDLGDGNLISNIYSLLDLCLTDDLTKFNSNFSLLKDEGQIKCEPSAPQTYTSSWAWNSNQTILTMEGYDYDLVELTSSTLRIKEVVADFDADGNPVTYTYSYTFTKQ
jgi:hypothetical protein